jgi:hypothetical protein
MKRTILITLFTLTCLYSFGQRIHFSDATNAWEIKNIDGHGDIFAPGQLSYSGTATIGSQTYLILGGNYIREDTTAKKVYMYCADSSEQVIYNYNSVRGDTLTIALYTSSRYPLVMQSWVVEMDSTKINNQWYKIWYFEGKLGNAVTDYFYNYTLIEGIGCMNGYDLPGSDGLQNEYFSTMYLEQVVCFQNNGATYPLSNPASITYTSLPIYNYDFDNASSCGMLRVNQASINNQTISLFPNPIDKSSKIVCSRNIQLGSLQVVNDIGQTIVNATFQNKKEILVGDLINTPGIYCYRVTDGQSGTVFTGKFIYR